MAVFLIQVIGFFLQTRGGELPMLSIAMILSVFYCYFMLENTETLTLEERIIRSLDTIMKTYGLSEEIRKKKIQIVLDMDYRKLGRRILKEFIKYVSVASEKGLLDVIVEK